jgi:hypothetical protein
MTAQKERGLQAASAPEAGEPLVTPEDHDCGYKDVPLEYRRGDPGPNPLAVRLSAPSRRAAPAILAGIQKELDRPDGDFMLPATLACLPPIYSNEAFLDSLTFECCGRLEAIAYVLTFGAPAQKKMAELLRTIGTTAIGSAPSSPSCEQGLPIGSK